MNLFQLAEVTLSSGVKSDFKIECEALTEEDWKCLAYLIQKKVGPFWVAVGVPRGGNALQIELVKYQSNDSRRVLIVDDVLTTGGSMEQMKKLFTKDGRSDKDIIGAVVFARGKCPDWIVPLFQM